MGSYSDNSLFRIVAAPWLVTNSGPVVQDGAVVLSGNTIVAAGERVRVVADYPDHVVEHFPGVLMPALFNSHMHLELSHLPAKEPLPLEQSFTDWIEALIERRMADVHSTQDAQALAIAQIQNQFESGVIYIGDIGNTNRNYLGDMAETAYGQEIYSMREMLAPSKQAVASSLKELKTLDTDEKVTAHAPYSTRPELLKAIKQRCDELGHIFSIHTCEAIEEKEFIRSSKGIFKGFLVKRGAWCNDFFKYGSRASTTVEYFSKLGLLNDKTVLVHCVHVTDSDLRLVKDSGAHICLCLGSNDFLHSGIAPIDKMLACGLLPAIGTDSISSNLQLDIWEEMRSIKKLFPLISSGDIIKMASLAGANAFGVDDQYGEIAEGKIPLFLHVYSDGIKNCVNESDLLNILVSNGRPEKIEWIHLACGNRTSN